MEEAVKRHVDDILSKINFYSVDYFSGLDSNEEGTLSPTQYGVPIRKLFVGNLAQRTTHKDLESVFAKFGKVDTCYLKRNVGKSNYAFVTFSNVSDALKARREGNRKEIQLHNRDLRVVPADSWHQPDSIENQRKLAEWKTRATRNTEVIEERMVHDYIANDGVAIHRLNDDCLVHIFLYLPIVDRVRIERVCKRWRAVSQESWRAVKRLDLSPTTWGFSSAKKRDVDTIVLRQVLLRCGRYLNLIDLSQLPHSLRQSTVTIIGKLCPNLQTIDISGLNVSAAGLESLTSNSGDVRKFSLGSCTSSIEQDLQRFFAKNRKLKYLRIVRNNYITGRSLGHLPASTIEEISLEGCSDILFRHFSTAIGKFEKLTSLSLKSCLSLNDEAMRAIGARVRSLKNLELCGYFPVMNAPAMLHIANLVHLERLNLHENLAVTDELLNAITERCKEIMYIDITGCHAVTDKGMVGITSLSKLQTLIMSDLGEVTDEALRCMHHLRTLECRGCPGIADPGISELVRFSSHLELLDLSGCDHVGNATIEAAIKATKERTKSSTVLKVIVGGTAVVVNELTEISPFLQIVNVDLSSAVLMRPDSDDEVDFLSESDDDWDTPSIYSDTDLEDIFGDRELDGSCGN